MVRIASVVALVLAASFPSPSAAAPLPNPPFLNGGFVSPSSTVLAQQQAIQKLIDKYVAKNDNCDRHALAALNKIYPPVGDGAPAALQKARDAWANCLAKVWSTVYVAGVDAIVQTGPPSCLAGPAIQNILDGSDFVRRYVRDFSFCDGDAANPDPLTHFAIPDSAEEVKAELRMHKPAIKAGVSVGHCYGKAAAQAFKNGGTLSAGDLDLLSKCEQKAVAKGVAVVQKVAAATVLPPCLSVANLQTQIEGAPSTATGIASLVFCAE
jgi:hypothetical protein